MKKILIVQVALLALVIIIGSLLKGDLSADALRMLHKITGVLAGLVAIVSVAAAFKHKSKPLIKVMLILAVLTTFAAGASGKAAVSGNGNYDTYFNKMRALAVVSVLLTVGSLATVGAPAVKKESEPVQD